MSFYRYIVILGVGTAICWLSWVCVLLFMNPGQSTLFSMGCFYLTLGIALIGTFSCLGSMIRFLRHRESVVSRDVGIASRQSVLFSALIIAALVFQSQRWLRWWNLLLLILLMVMIEIFLISRRRVG